MLAFCRLSLDLGSDGFVVESTLVPPDMQTLDYVRLCDVSILFLCQPCSVTWLATWVSTFPHRLTCVQPIYNPNTSTTGSQIDGYTWGVTYGGFSLEGVVFNDAVTLGENTWTNMTIEVVTGEPTGSPVE